MNFRESPKGEVRRIPFSGTSSNRVSRKFVLSRLLIVLLAVGRGGDYRLFPLYSVQHLLCLW
jgi:hypothetical protein